MITFKHLSRRIAIAVVGVPIIAIGSFALSLPAVAADNLVLNPSFETQRSTGLPTNWFKDKYGSGTAVWSYPAVGIDNTRAAGVTLSNNISAEAGWRSSNVVTTPGASYYLSGRYQATVASYLQIRWLSTSGAYSYQTLSPMPGASTVWGAYNYIFTAPVNASKLAIIHYINKNGTLTVDDISLTKAGGGTTADTIAPIVNVTAPTSGASVSGTVNFAASASDNVGVTGVQLYLDNKAIGSLLTTAPYTTGWNSIGSLGAHSILAVARDAAGNRATSTPVNFTVVAPPPGPDTIAPTVSVTYPTAGASASGTIVFKASASDNIGVTGVQFYLDNKALGSLLTVAPYTASWDSTVSIGNHSVLAVARDAAGNRATSTIINFTVTAVPPPPSSSDTTTPIALITDPLTGTTLSHTVAVKVTASDPVIAGRITSGIKSVELFLDGVSQGARNAVATEYLIDTTLYPNGSHTLTAIARDNAGNTSQPAGSGVTFANGAAASGPNLIANPSLESDSAAPGVKPDGWEQGNWGTNATTFAYPAIGRNGGRAATVAITAYTDGDAKWYFADVTVNPGQEYTYTQYYRATVPSTAVIRYQRLNGTFLYLDAAYLAAAADWTSYTKTFSVPANENIISFTMFHFLNRVGSLTVDDYSLTIRATTPFDQGYISLNFDDGWLSAYQNGLPILDARGLKSTQYIISDTLGDPGYVSRDQMLDMQTKGHELGSHSKTHPQLPLLSLAAAREEISGSKTDLEALGVTAISSFSYPYGEWNEPVVGLVKEGGYLGARTAMVSDGGMNSRDGDPFLLKTYSIEYDTPVATVKAIIDQALQNKTWAILVLHQIENTGLQYSTTPANLTAIADHLLARNAAVITNTEGVYKMTHK